MFLSLYPGPDPTYDLLQLPLYRINDQYKAVHVVVNKVGPFNNPTETYRYYSLPYCHTHDDIDDEAEDALPRQKREARPQDVQMVGRGVPGRALSSKLGRCALALAGGWCRT